MFSRWYVLSLFCDMVYINFNYIIYKLFFASSNTHKKISINCHFPTKMESEVVMEQQLLRERLLQFICEEGVNQKYIAKKTRINEGLLSQYKNCKHDLRLLDRESLDEFLRSKGY